MRIETEYEKKLKIKNKQRAAFRRFVRGQSTPVHIREWIGLNYQEVKILLESRMLPAMNWANYGSYWVIDHVVPFWLFDLEKESDMKLLWHPDNLMPMIWADNNHKQGDLQFSITKLSLGNYRTHAAEKLIEIAIKAKKVMDKYLLPNHV